MKFFFLLITATIIWLPVQAQSILLDTTFDPGIGPDASVLCVANQDDGKVLVGGFFDQYNNGSPLTLSAVRLNTDGTLDSSFDPDPMEPAGTVYKIIVQSDGKIIFVGAGRFGWPPNSFGAVRLNADGSLDASFDMQGEGFNNSVVDGVLQPDGKLILCGPFTQFNGIQRNGIARLNADGTLDTTFDPLQGFDQSPDVVVLQDDGKILVGGYFNLYNGVTRNHIVRLNADGSLDNAFDPGNQFTDDIRSIAVQPDGRIVVGGNLIENFPFGVIRPRIRRLNADGSIDNSFDPGDGFNSYPYAFHFQSDGKIIVAGDFATFNNTQRKGIARLNADGSLDGSFDPGSGFESIGNPGLSFVNDMTVLDDGKILVVGNYETYDGTPRNRITRLIGDGSTAALENISEQPTTWSVYPSPAQDVIHIEHVEGNKEFEILNASGQVVFTDFTRHAVTAVDISTLPNGLYLLKINGTASNLKSRRFYISR
jgi:uncharacterized delta-60 repeat protein